jgi:2-polyprenyl-6-methoxyphenol hydroxylase-like FAD-dependent oxidoreductase
MKEELVEVKYDFLVGADGANSAVRSQIFRLEERNPHSSNEQEPLKMDIQHNVHNFKSLYIGPLVARKSFLHPHHDRVQVSSLVGSSCIFTTAGKIFHLCSMFQALFFSVSFLK